MPGVRGCPPYLALFPLPGQEGGQGDGRNGCGAATPPERTAEAHSQEKALQILRQIAGAFGMRNIPEGMEDRVSPLPASGAGEGVEGLPWVCRRGCAPAV